MRRVQRGSVKVRKDPDDCEEWQFQDDRVQDFESTVDTTSCSVQKKDKISFEVYMSTKMASLSSKDFNPEAVPQSLVALVGSKGASSLKDMNKTSSHDSDVEEVPEGNHDVQSIAEDAEKLTQFKS